MFDADKVFNHPTKVKYFFQAILLRFFVAAPANSNLTSKPGQKGSETKKPSQLLCRTKLQENRKYDLLSKTTASRNERRTQGNKRKSNSRLGGKRFVTKLFLKKITALT